jgi:flagellar motility protein MotE (MotC chaperone)
MRKIRLLPMVIAFAGVTLAVKLGAMWEVAEFAFFTPRVALAQEKSKPEAKAENAENQDKKKQEAKADAKSEDKKAAMAAGESAEPGKAKDVKDAGKAEKSGGFDPSQATDAEVEVLQKLAVRRVELDKRSREIDLRETMLVATERRVEAKIATLKKYQTMVQDLLKKYDKEQEAKYRSLVKIYESMKPKNAARIFEQLDMKVLLNVVERMREARTGPILAKMSPAKAKAVTAALADRGKLPALAKK